MKIKLLSTLLLLTCQLGFCQTEKTLKGKIYFENSIVPDVEVINANTKKLTVSDGNGNFSIVAKAKDLLVFISKKYELQKILLEKETLDKAFFSVFLSLKPEQLKEVVVTKMPSLQLSKDKNWEQGKLDKLALEKAVRTPKILGMNNGTIENGMDFMRIGGMILGLFKKEKEEVKKQVPQIEFTALARNTCDQKFYLQTLKLKPEEIALFLQFCDADPKSRLLVENSNILSMMDFLSTKNIEFKKL
ncbi:hypothetical protein H4V97_001705 [Flavobacterium sp. CG_23.5]|uniref:hypothetical protein n=1 Tax=unclassified Flavobacterium TaxID=196869 RepID=UPI0018CAEB31|nr:MULTISPECIES: hypothetical protein [unclassified Flavobacterium]MBG6109366.1 hypothetical protein [Flavobacterium sp. CG_9.10]MBP2283387.1 hypothetical protein [Flavobacterium sp. CG_23.5]